MGLAGAGYGAVKSLEDLVKEQRIRQALEAEIQNRERALAEQHRSNVADEGMRTRGLDIQEQNLNEQRAERTRAQGEQRAMAMLPLTGPGRIEPSEAEVLQGSPVTRSLLHVRQALPETEGVGPLQEPETQRDELPAERQTRVTNERLMAGQQQTAADRAEDNARQLTQFNESARHNRAMESKPDKPTYVQYTDPDGNLRVATPEEIRAQGSVPQLAKAGGLGTAPIKMRAQRTAAALNSVEKLKTLAPKRSPGPAGIVQGAGQQLSGMLGYNTGARQYQALLGPTAMQIAVAVQGAANLSDSEREAMKGMLGNISTMDYESQIALLDNASELLRTSGANVQQVGVKDPQTGMTKMVWQAVEGHTPSSDSGAAAGPTAVQDVVYVRDPVTGKLVKQ